MSNRDLLRGRPPGKPAGLRIVDVDIHVNDPPQVLVPDCGNMAWRKSLAAAGEGRQGYVDIPGYAPGGLKSDPRIPGGHKRRSVNTKEEMREELDLLGIDEGVMIPDNLLNFASLANADYAEAVSHAYNRWLTAEWVDAGNGLYGAVLACAARSRRHREGDRALRRNARNSGSVLADGRGLSALGPPQVQSDHAGR